MKLFKRLIYKSRFLRELYLYLNYHKDINEYYNYCLKEGWPGCNEEAGWREMTYAWERADSYDPKEE